MATGYVGCAPPSKGNVKLTSDVRRSETLKDDDFHLVFHHTFSYFPIPDESRQLRHKEMLEFGIR